MEFDLVDIESIDSDLLDNSEEKKFEICYECRYGWYYRKLCVYNMIYDITSEAAEALHRDLARYDIYLTPEEHLSMLLHITTLGCVKCPKGRIN